MTAKDTLKNILLVGAPLLISQMSQYLMTLADTAMVGRLGAGPLAAISIGSASSWLLFVFVWPVSVGVQVVAARRFGRNQALETSTSPRGENNDDAELPLMPVLGAGLVFTVIASILSLLLSSLAHPLYSRILSDADTVQGALSYLAYTRWAVPFIGLGMVIQGFMNSMRRTRAVMALTVSSNLLNVFFNWVFIFGALGAPKMGLAGAGLATLLSQVVQTLGLWIYMAVEPRLAAYRRQSMRPDSGLIRRVASLSLPVAVQNGAFMFIILFFDTLVENQGTAYLATAQIVFSFFRINKTIVGGFARGAGILAGNALGADDDDGARRVMRIQQGLGILIGLIVMIIVLSFSEVLIRIFTNDAEVMAIGVPVMRFFAAFFFIEISAFSLEIVFQAVGWSRYVLFSEFSTNVVFILGATLLLMNFTGLGIWGAWLGFGLYQVGHALILAAGWLSGRWLKVKVEQ